MKHLGSESQRESLTNRLKNMEEGTSCLECRSNGYLCQSKC